MGLLTLLLASLISVHGGDSGAIGIRRFVSPDYPNVARWAQVSGEVHLLAKVDESGRVEGADVLSGPPLLAKYARQNLLNWCYTKQPIGGKIEVVYHYRLQGRKIYGAVVPTVSLESPTDVVVTSNPPLPAGGSPE